MITSDTGQQSSQKNSSILSTLAQHFPFVFDLLRKHHPQFNEIQGKHSHVNASCDEINSGLTHERGNGIDENSTAEDLQTVLSRDDNELYASRFDCFSPFGLVHLMISLLYYFSLDFVGIIIVNLNKVRLD